MAPVTPGLLQLYKVPFGITPFKPSTGVTVNDTPLQDIAVIAVTAGVGFTLTVTVKAAPTPQLRDVGVTT